MQTKGESIHECERFSTLFASTVSTQFHFVLMNAMQLNMWYSFVRIVWYETALFKNRFSLRSLQWWWWRWRCNFVRILRFLSFVLHFEYYKYLHYHAQHEHERYVLNSDRQNETKSHTTQKMKRKSIGMRKAHHKNSIAPFISSNTLHRDLRLPDAQTTLSKRDRCNEVCGRACTKVNNL